MKKAIESKKSEVSSDVVSRAENKLAGASQAFSFDFRDKTVLDIGSSTGGFTEYALRRGAKRVFAVEKGTNQMKAPLRFDPRITLLEKTDIFLVDFTQFGQLDVVLADVSFVSLKKVLTHVKLQPEVRSADFLMMLKPQFEAKPFQLKNGIVKNEKIRREIIKDFELWLKQNHFKVVDKRDNFLAGKNGNVERFYYWKLVENSVRSHYNHK